MALYCKRGFSKVFICYKKTIVRNLFSLTVLLFLSISSFAQNVDFKNIEGRWIFERAEFESYQQGNPNNSLEKIVVENIASYENKRFPIGVVFQSVKIANGKLYCLLAGSEFQNSIYLLEDYQLSLSNEAGEKKESEGNEQNEELPQSVALFNYEYSLKGNNLEFIFYYQYGDSRYNFPLESKVVMTLVRQ